MQWRPSMLALLLCMVATNAHAVIFYRVSGLSDFNLGPWSIADPAVTSSMDICVHTTLAGNYSITATSAGGYRLVNGANQIPYTLRWEDSGAGNLGSSGGTALTNGVALTNRQRSNSSLFSDDCSTGTPAGATARLYLSITKAAMIAAPGSPTPYVGVLTLMVAAP